MAWKDEKMGWLKIKEGDITDFTIEDIIQKEANGKIQAIPGKSYYYEFTTDQGALTVNNLGLFQALVKTGVNKGDKILIKYVKKGTLGNPSVFEIQILQKAQKTNEVDTDETPEETPEEIPEEPPF